jgi:DNA polymerase-3 subunit delta'
MLEQIVGQPHARQLLASSLSAPVHAYLFVGPSGSGKRDAARAFAAALVCAEGGCGQCADCRGVLASSHPDVVVVERSGASILVADAEEVIALSQRTPRRARYQVIVLTDFHLVDEAAPMLLKTIEEPPDTTIFIVVADVVTPPLVTIASRCLRVEFASLDAASIEEILSREGFPADAAREAAALARGRIDRARLLVGDSGYHRRQALWSSVPDRLDGSGATVALVAKELASSCDELLSVLRERQAAEIARAQSAADAAGLRAIPGRQQLEDRHRREIRRVRTDELRAGLASLSSSYRHRLNEVNLPHSRAQGLVRACERIDEVATNLIRNPNELLLLEALLLELDSAR